MLQNRRDILANLKTALTAVTELKTVVRTYGGVDIGEYLETDLPLADIVEPEEDPQDLTGQRQMIFIDTRVVVYFVHWGVAPNATYETLMKKIRNKIGDSFTLTETATGCWVVSVSKVTGNFPLFSFELGLKIKYYLEEKDT